MAGQRGQRPRRLLRRARKHRRGGGLPYPGDPVLVQGATAPQPAHPAQLDQNGPPRDSMATTSPRAASLSLRAF